MKLGVHEFDATTVRHLTDVSATGLCVIRGITVATIETNGTARLFEQDIRLACF